MTEDKFPEKKKSKWLVMAFLAGDNNLSAHSIAFLQELEAAQCTEPVKDCKNRVRVIAAFDSPTPWPKGVRYLEIKRHEDPANPYHGQMKWPLHNNLLGTGHIVVSPDFCNEGSSSSRKPPIYVDEPTAEEALNRFFLWVQDNYEAEKYMLILFGHGTLVAGNTFLADTNPPSYLKLGEFAKVLKSFRPKINILACDNCVMNGIETAVELREKVEYMLGSQDLMLANGWPVKLIIEDIRKALKSNPAATPKEIAMTVLRASVINVLDFTLMDRSLEQAICDVTKFGQKDKIVSAVRTLSGKLQDGLQFKGIKKPVLCYPMVVDIVRLARLEAQSYWSETFVDLYDFAALLVKKCDECLRMLRGPADLIKVISEIRASSMWITHIFRTEQIVPSAYYVGPKLQYSHGVSIYFPWTLPEDPVTFEPIPRAVGKPKNYYLKTPFEEYRTYTFAKPAYGDWTRFLVAFLKATLRDVRRVEYALEHNSVESDKLLDRELVTVVIDLQKSSSSTGEDDDCVQIKNYPRRFYISPADCKRRSKIFGLPHDNAEPEKNNVLEKAENVNYLGWKIRGLVADVLGVPQDLPPRAANDEAET